MIEPVANLTKGFVYRKNLLYILSVLKEADEKDWHHTIMLRYRDGEWGNWDIDARVISMCAFDTPQGRTVLSMGIDGRIQVARPMGFSWEVVDASDEGPSTLRHLTAMRLIGQYVYVAGMARQVYRRAISGGDWQRADRGALVPWSSKEIAGFKAIDGFGEGDIYAAGFYGQIWHFDGAMWSPCDSPTNVLLTSVRCVTPGVVYIAGAGGLVLRGDKDRWEVIVNEATQDTFWSLESFGDTLYLATKQNSIFKVEKDAVVPVDLGLNRDVTTNWLHANDGVLLSVGTRDLILFDGQSWADVPHP